MSFLARRNPSVKVALVLAISLALTPIIDPFTPLAALAGILAAGTLLGGIPPGRLARALAPLALIGLGFVWTNALLARGGGADDELARWGPFVVSASGLRFGLGLAARGLAIGALSVVLALTTDPSNLIASLVRHARLPYRIAYPLLAAYRFLPAVAAERTQIALARRARGIGIGGSPGARTAAELALALTLLTSGVRRATRVAIAMDARGFGASPARTYLRRPPLSAADAAFAAGTLLLLAGVIALGAAAGWLRFWDGRFAA